MNGEISIIWIYHFSFLPSLLSLVRFFDSTLPTITGFLSAMCCAQEEEKLIAMLILPNKNNLKRSSRLKECGDLFENEVPLLLDKKQLKRILKVAIYFVFFIICFTFEMGKNYKFFYICDEYEICVSYFNCPWFSYKS